MNENKCGFYPADILLPDFSRYDGEKWACIACDQFTSEPDYWHDAEKKVGKEPSTLNLMIPEIYLSETEDRLPKVHKTMDDYLGGVLCPHEKSMIYVERTQSDGRVRRGIVGMIDLEKYDYTKGADSLIRATEGTVLERIPPRVAVRRGAKIELPHVMLLIDDAEKSVIEPTAGDISGKAYDFDLMLGGGHIRGSYISDAGQKRIIKALEKLADKKVCSEKYGAKDIAPLLFAVGDGNHSLAAAKAAYEEIKKRDGEAALGSNARYALCEVVNLHDDALDFEPIYRVVFGADVDDMLTALERYADELDGGSKPQKIKCIFDGKEKEIVVKKPLAQLTVGTLQNFLDEYSKQNGNIKIDYIHDEKSLRTLAGQKGSVGFLFDGMGKDELFRTVIFDGALPRKTFSMGHARDKRYYLECRKVK